MSEKKLMKKQYEKKMEELQIELVKLQDWGNPSLWCSKKCTSHDDYTSDFIISYFSDNLTLG